MPGAGAGAHPRARQPGGGGGRGPGASQGSALRTHLRRRRLPAPDRGDRGGRAPGRRNPRPHPRPPGRGSPLLRRREDPGLRRGRRAALAGLLAGHARDPEVPTQGAPGVSLLGDDPRAGSIAGARLPQRARVHLALRGPGRTPADRALLLRHHRAGEGCEPGTHPRVRGSRERHHLLQHEERRTLRDDLPAAPGLRRGPDLGRSHPGGPRAGDGEHQERAAALPGSHRRGGPRHRHQRPEPRDRLLGPAVTGGVRAPHRTHRPRRQGGDRHLAGVGPRHRELPLPAAGEQDRDQGAQAPDRRGDPRAAARAPEGEGRAGDARASGARAELQRRSLRPDRRGAGIQRGGTPRSGRHLRRLSQGAPTGDERDRGPPTRRRESSPRKSSGARSGRPRGKRPRRPRRGPRS